MGIIAKNALASLYKIRKMGYHERKGNGRIGVSGNGGGHVSVIAYFTVYRDFILYS